MTTERPWRLFIAVPLPDALRTDLARSVATWRSDARAEGLSWNDPDGWHVTLAFLGRTDAGRVPELARALERVAAAQPPFSLAAGGVGGFPSARRARVVWFGVDDAVKRLRRLAGAVRREVEVEGGPFRGHVTVARARDRRGVDLTGWIRPEEAPRGTLPVDRLVLFRSHLGRGPAVYEALVDVPMGAMVRA